jgi:hypothetical protein
VAQKGRQVIKVKECGAILGLEGQSGQIRLGTIVKVLVRSSTALCFKIYNFGLEFLKEFKVLSCIIRKPTLSSNSWGGRVVYKSFLLLAGALLLVKKIYPKGVQAVFQILLADRK